MIEKTTLEKQSKSNIDWRPLIAFFVTLAGAVVMFGNLAVTPFGGRNILTSDLAAQYGPYLIGLRNALKNGESLLYSQAQGLGQNTMGIFAYYLSSPLNIIVLLMPKNNLQEAITIMICVKLAFAGAFMTWLLDRKFDTKTRMTIVFGMMYPFCSFVMVFFFNIMWLDGIALMPLLILTTERFVKNRRLWPGLTLLLLLLFVSGYYMAYMIGIFSFLYLVGMLGFHGELKGEKGKESGKTIGLFILSAVTAGMISAAVLIPAGINTLQNGDYTKAEALTLDPNFKLIDLVDQFFPNGAPTLSNNLPFIFCGVPVLLLFGLFFFNKSIEKRRKVAIGIVCVVSLLSFHLSFLNRVWHLFDDPNWFNYRYSYIFSFIMIMVAFYSYLHMKGAGKKAFLLSYGVVVLLCVISQSAGAMGEEKSIFFAILFFATLETALLFGTTVDQWPEEIANLKNIGAPFLVIVILVEMVFFTPQQYLPNILGKDMDAPGFVLLLDDLDTLAENIDRSTWSRTENDSKGKGFVGSNNLPYYINTKAISTFASMANKKTNHFLKQLGYETNYNYFSVDHDSAIIAADAFMGVRYIVTNEHNLSGLVYKANVDKYYLYENPYYLPIAYLVKSDAASFDGFALEKDQVEKNYFTFQENWITSLSGIDASALYDTFTSEWEVFNGQKTDVAPEGKLNPGEVVINSLNHEKPSARPKALQIYLRSNTTSEMILRTKVTVEEALPMYFVVPYPYLQNDATVYVNDRKIATQGTSFYSRIISLGTFRKGETIQIEIRTKNDILACYEPILAYCHPQELLAQKEALASTVSDLDVKDGHIKLVAHADQDKLLLTTIPFEDGWAAYVDGQKVQLQAYQDAFLSIPVSSGTHNVELKFTPPGFKAGLASCGAGILLFAVVTILMLRKKKDEKTAVTAAADDTNTKNEEEKV
ncbi:MAG: YfhO family protein [Clostridiales bacterium]|nr:YfhO family protein [Clostridiales bacterium]